MHVYPTCGHVSGIGDCCHAELHMAGLCRHAVPVALQLTLELQAWNSPT